MLWIFLATLGQFINAIVAILDKYIVSDEKVLPKPFVYAFYSCLFTGFWVIVYLLSYAPFIPFVSSLPSFGDVEKPTLIVVALSLLAAYTFFFALVSMFNSLKEADTSDVLPVIGAVSGLSSLGMSYYFLDASLSQNFIYSILLLVIGTYLVSRNRLKNKLVFYCIHSGIFFALHLITMKALFEETTFGDGFFWSRVGLIFFALSLLLIPSYYEKIQAQTALTSKRTGLLVLINKVLAGIAAFLLLKATDIGEVGDVAVVQALDGLKYIFILIIAVFFGKLIPTSAGENDTRPENIVRKVLYVAIISAGFFVLFL